MESIATQCVTVGARIQTHEGWRHVPRAGTLMRFVPGRYPNGDSVQIMWDDGTVGFEPVWRIHPARDRAARNGLGARIRASLDNWRHAYKPGRVAKAAWAIGWGLARSLKLFAAFVFLAFATGHLLLSLPVIPIRPGPFVPVLELLVGVVCMVPVAVIFVILKSLRMGRRQSEGNSQG